MEPPQNAPLRQITAFFLRTISRFGKDGPDRKASAKLPATLIKYTVLPIAVHLPTFVPARSKNQC